MSNAIPMDIRIKKAIKLIAKVFVLVDYVSTTDSAIRI